MTPNAYFACVAATIASGLTTSCSPLPREAPIAANEHPDGDTAVPEEREPWLPPPALKEPWVTLEKQGFSEWQIAAFSYAGNAADGGSAIFEFETKLGQEFVVLAAASHNYATDAEMKRRHQVFYLECEGRYYKVAQGSAQEALLIERLNGARERLKGMRRKDPRFIDKLILHLRSRAYLEMSDEFIEELLIE